MVENGNQQQNEPDNESEDYEPVIAGQSPNCTVDIEEGFEFLHPKVPGGCNLVDCSHYYICRLWEGSSDRGILSIPPSVSANLSSSNPSLLIRVYSPSEIRISYESTDYSADLELVGDGNAHAWCGTYYKKICKEPHPKKELSEQIVHQRTLEGLPEVSNGVEVHVHKWSCHRPSCPVCWPDWRRRAVARVKTRFDAYTKTLNRYKKRHVKLCHGALSVPKKLWDLPKKSMEKTAYRYLKQLGIVGGTLIYHPKRQKKNQKGYWYFSPHFHVYFPAWNGYVNGDAVTKLYNRTSWVFRNFGERPLTKSLSYQLSHAGVPSGKKHSIVRWFGELNYRKLHVEKHESNGPEKCSWGHEMQIGYCDKKIEIVEKEGYQVYLSSEGWHYLPKRQSDCGYSDLPECEDGRFRME